MLPDRDFKSSRFAAFGASLRSLHQIATKLISNQMKQWTINQCKLKVDVRSGRSGMTCSAYALIVFFANTLSSLSSEALQPRFGYKYCTYRKLDPTGKYNCPLDWTCKLVIGLLKNKYAHSAFIMPIIAQFHKGLSRVTKRLVHLIGKTKSLVFVYQN